MKFNKILAFIILGIIMLQLVTVIGCAQSQNVTGEYRGAVDRDTNIKIIIDQHNKKYLWVYGITFCLFIWT